MQTIRRREGNLNRHSHETDSLFPSLARRRNPRPPLVALARNVANSETKHVHIMYLACSKTWKQENSSPNPIDEPYPETKLSKPDRSPTHTRLPTPPQIQEPIHPHDTTPHYTTMNRNSSQLHPSTFDPSTWPTTTIISTATFFTVTPPIPLCHLS